MKNCHIAYIGIPHHPHVNSTLPIIAVLVRRGYRVTYVTSELFASRVADLGAEVLLCPKLFDIFDEAQAAGDDINSFCRLATRILVQFTPFYDVNRPDLILYDFQSMAGRIFANKWNIPAIQTSPHFAFNKAYFDCQVKDAEFRRFVLDIGTKADDFLIRHGVASEDFFFHREKLNIHLFSTVLEPIKEAIDDSRFYAGRCAGEQAYYGDWQNKKSDGRPIVLVASSTSYVQGLDHFKMCIDALAGLELHVIVSLGYGGDPASLGPLPPHFEIVQRQSHLKILSHASLLIGLGGTISSSEATYHGVPQIMLSYGFQELEFFAEIYEKNGFAVHLRKADTTADNIRKLAMQVFQDTAMLNRMKQIRRTVRREPGGEETANRIEEYIDTYCAKRTDAIADKSESLSKAISGTGG